MDIRTMRIVDRWLGIPLCAGATLVRWVEDALVRRAERPIRRILFIKLAEQGSTVIAVPALRRAVEEVGRENVYFLAFEENRFILDVMDLIPAENVLTIRTGGVVGTLWRTLRAVLDMRRLDLDAAVDLEFFARSSAILAYASGARLRSGFHPFGGEGSFRGDLLTHRLRFSPHIHTAPLYRLLVDALWLDGAPLPTSSLRPAETDDTPPPFEPGEAELERVRRLLAEASGVRSPSPLVLLNPNCSDIMPLRAWPREQYVELAGRLLERYPDAHIGITGAPSEADALGAVVRQVGSPRCFNLAGRTSLRDLLGVYCLADVLVTNDSGPAHFATLTPIQVVTLFGPEHPSLFAARSPRNHVLWSGVACSPCITALNNRTSPCTDNVCMQEISVESVLEVVCRILDAEGEVPPAPVIPAARGAPVVQVTASGARVQAGGR